MKTYQANGEGSLTIEKTNIPKGHPWYAKALAEAEAGEAEILPYLAAFESLIDGVVVKNEDQELEYVKALKLNQLIQQADAAVAPIINTYPKIEVDSWPKQIEEANAWLADNTAITPLIDGIAMQRGIDKTVLVGKILENSFNYSTISGNVIGARQKLEGQIIAASTLAEIEAIEVVI